MSGIMDLIGGMLTQGNVEQIAKQLGVAPEKAHSALGMAVPALLQGLQNNTTKPEGAEALLGALQRDHMGGSVDIAGLLANFQGSGPGILKHVLGAKQPMVQQGIGQATGLDAGAVGNLLQVLAPVVMGSLGKTAQSQGINANTLSNLLGAATGQAKTQQPQAFNLVTALLDQNKDGNVVDDVVRMVGSFLKR
jgi:hypothetical protein